MLSRSHMFAKLVEKSQPAVSGALQYASSIINRGGGTTTSVPSVQGPNYGRFTALTDASQSELLSAIKSLQNYSTNSRKANDRRRKLFKMMSWRQQKLCEDVGYLRRLTKIDHCITTNQHLLNGIAETTIESFGLSYRDFDKARQKTASSPFASTNLSATNYRVIESLGHYVRDWSSDGSAELKPMLNYITSQLDELIPSPQDRAKTCVIVPGSGLGRLAHEISLLSNGSRFGGVHAVEFSGLMNICNEFIYNSAPTTIANGNQKHTLYPYIHSSSNFVNTDSQFRSIDILTSLSKPDNLTLHHQDFRYFQIPNLQDFENVVVVSAFFIDTAENLIDYFDAINALTCVSTPKNSDRKNIKRGFWINIGPLKYGSAAQAELTAEEIGQIRRKMGWKDLHSDSTLSSPKDSDRLAGYITDKESLWQGYYGLTRWASKRTNNKN